MQHARTLRYAAIIIALGFLSSLATRTFTSNAALTTTSVQLKSSDDSGLHFSLAVPDATVDADGLVAVEGLDGRMSEPGVPDLPFYSTLIALPPAADAQLALSVSDVSAETVAAVRPVRTVNIDPERDIYSITSLDAEEQVFEQDEAIYSADADWPAVRYELSEPMYLRDLRVVELKLYPLSYNPATQTLNRIKRFDVGISFTGAARGAAQPLAGASSVPSYVLNADKAGDWRSVPDGFAPQATSFPIGKQTLKITVDQDGIYELTRADLIAAGMTVSPAALDTSTIEMMHQGQPVAYELIDNDGDNVFDVNDVIRFYGWAFDGSRHDKLFVGDSNVFWLWADGSPTTAQSVNNGSGGTTVTEWRSTVEREEAHFFTQGKALHRRGSWDNERDAWYMVAMKNGVTETLAIDLPDPVTVGASPASVLTEVSNVRAPGDIPTHRLTVSLNNDAANGQLFTWSNWANRNLVMNNVAASTLNDGQNLIKLWPNTENVFSNDMHVKRVAVTYDRQLMAVDDVLAFEYGTAGNQSFEIGGFTVSQAADVVAWDISDARNPKIVTLTNGDISTSGGANMVNLRVANTANGAYVVSSSENLLSPASLSTYEAESLEPSGNSAKWVAIAYGSFIPKTEELATHRAATSKLTTHVVNVEDVYNQYGYGLAIPEALQNFLTHSMGNWDTTYALFVGDATENPLKRTCSTGPDSSSVIGCPFPWVTTDENYVLTDFQFIDRFNGMVPTDHTFATLMGNDELEDISVGRLTVSSVTQLTSLVDKIKQYETGISQPTNPQYAWMNNLIWLSDNDDDGGNFCDENEEVRDLHVTPANFQHTSLCLNDYFDNFTDPDLAVGNLRNDFYLAVGVSGARIVNYRGHGSTTEWAQEEIVSTESASDNWSNINKPTVILSADCLDGSFTRSGIETLGETFLALDKVGTAAHWSSSGLGFSFEHTVLHTGFYDALYQEDMVTIGDGVRYAKNHYRTTTDYDDSEIYSFILQGDPAMLMEPVPVTTTNTYLPFLTK